MFRSYLNALPIWCRTCGAVCEYDCLCSSPLFPLTTRPSASMTGIELEGEGWKLRLDFEGLVARLGANEAETVWDEVDAKLSLVRPGVTYRRLEPLISQG